jgi:hypothetical protein
MGHAEIEASRSLTHLAVEQKVAASTQTQALSALLFLRAAAKKEKCTLRLLSRSLWKQPDRRRRSAVHGRWTANIGEMGARPQPGANNSIET